MLFCTDDRFDPMMPLTRRNGDLRFLSLEVPSFYFGLVVRMLLALRRSIFKRRIERLIT